MHAAAHAHVHAAAHAHAAAAALHLATFHINGVRRFQVVHALVGAACAPFKRGQRCKMESGVRVKKKTLKV